MTDKFTVKTITRDLEFLLTLTRIFDTDDAHFWRDKGTDKRFVYKIDANDQPREVAVFQDPLPKGDYHLFNPFAEGIGVISPATRLFETAALAAANLNLEQVIRYVTQEILTSKAAQTLGEEHTLSHMVMRMSSVPVDRKTSLFEVVDDKMTTEFDTILKRIDSDIITIPYYKPRMTATVRCEALTDPAKWDEKFGKDIRKKSLTAFRIIIQGILGITKPEELDQFTTKYDPDLKTSARLYAITSTYLKFYNRFNDVLGVVVTDSEGNPRPDNELDLGELAAVIDRFGSAHTIAKHMVQPIVSVAPTDTRAANTSQLRFSDQPTGTSRFPGPRMVDEMGRAIPPGGSGLQLGGGLSPQGTSRFAPHVIPDSPLDPLAPSTRMIGGFSPNVNRFGGGGFGGASGFGQQGFGQGLSLGGSNPLDFRPPSNFGQPGIGRGF